MHKENIADEP